MNQSERKAKLHNALRTTREKTLWLFAQVPNDFLKVRVHDFYSPLGWHFGHIGMTEEYWTCVRAEQRPCLDDALSFLFANIPDNPKEERVNLPDREAILTYLAETRRAALDALREVDLESPDPLLTDGYAWEFALQHECQHQETICEMLQLICKQTAPAPVSEANSESLPNIPSDTEMISLPSGTF